MAKTEGTKPSGRQRSLDLGGQPSGPGFSDTVETPTGEVGATISTTYLRRKQTVLPVNKNDLEDILDFDGMEIIFCGLGVFLLSGAIWLGIEKVSEQESFEWTVLLVVCAASIITGVIFLSAGGWAHYKKRRRIKRIFEETEEI